MARAAPLARAGEGTRQSVAPWAACRSGAGHVSYLTITTTDMFDFGLGLPRFKEKGPMLLNKFSFRAFMTAVATAVLSCTASAQGVLAVKDVSLRARSGDCPRRYRPVSQGWISVTVTVMNRAGQVVVVLRDDGTSPHTVDTSRRKAYTAVALCADSVDGGQAFHLKADSDSGRSRTTFR